MSYRSLSQYFFLFLSSLQCTLLFCILFYLEFQIHKNNQTNLDKTVHDLVEGHKNVAITSYNSL